MHGHVQAIGRAAFTNQQILYGTGFVPAFGQAHSGQRVDRTEAIDMAMDQACTIPVRRAVDGAVGARWMSAFKGYLENPLTFML